MDLLRAVEGTLVERLISDPVLLCDVVYVVCKEEADSKDVSDEDFGRAMAGDALEHATTALLEELIDFFPQGRRRLLKKALAKLKTLEARALKVAETRLESQEIEAEMEAVLAEKLGMEAGIVAPPGDSSGSSPESLESTPAD